MTDDLERQIRAWVEDINDPIPIDDVRLHQHRQAPATKRGHIVLAVAAAFLLIAGSVAVLASSGSSTLETVADSDDDATTTVPQTSTAPTTAAPEAPDESATTTTAAPTTTASTTTTTTTTSTAPPRTPRTGTVSEVVDPPDGENCEGLRSRTVWASTEAPDEIDAAAGGRTDYVETVTNEGTETCPVAVQPCPGPGALFTAEGEPVPRAPTACPAVAYAPTELAPGQSRRDVFTVELFTKPGEYELRVPQHDGRIATLPIRLEPQVSPCDAGTLTLDQQPYDAGASGNGTAFAQLFIDSAQQSCTIRITDTRLTLRSEGDPAAAERTFVDGAERWYVTQVHATNGEATFGPIDLAPGRYEGAITVQLENGEILRKPARLSVR